MNRHNLIVLLAVLFVIAILFGGIGAPHSWGFWGWSPAGLIIVVFILVLLLG